MASGVAGWERGPPQAIQMGQASLFLSSLWGWVTFGIWDGEVQQTQTPTWVANALATPLPLTNATVGI